MQFETKIQGYAAFDKLLSALPDRVENKILQSAISSAAKIGSKYIKAAAPQVKNYPPATAQAYWYKKTLYGHLYKSIKLRTSKRDKAKGIRGAFISTGKAYWGYILENGSRYISARPWFLPSFERAVPEMVKEIEKKVGDGILNEALNKSGGGEQ